MNKGIFLVCFLLVSHTFCDALDDQFPSKATKKIVNPETATIETTTTIQSQTTATSPTTTPSPITTPSPTTTPPTTTLTPSTSTPANTTPGPTTTPHPNEPPKFVVNSTGSVCLVVQADLTIYIPYNNGQVDVVKTFNIKQAEVVNGSCGNNIEHMTLSWSPEHSPIPYNLSFIFAKLPSSASNVDTSVLQEIHFAFLKSKMVFPDTKDEGYFTVDAKGSFFKTPASSGYTCSPQQNVTLHGTPDVFLGFSLIHFEAFRNSTSSDFGNKTMDCSAVTPPNNTVAIAVGVTATVLIVLAVVAFIVGRRRRAQGYQRL